MLKLIVMRIVFIFTIVILLYYTSKGQDTRIQNLCHIGVDRIDVTMSYQEEEYYLYTYIVKVDGFYIDKGNTCTITTVNNDTIRLSGLLSGQAELESNVKNLMVSPGYAKFNAFPLTNEHMIVLRSNPVSSIEVELSNSKMKMNVTSLREWVLMKQVESVEKIAMKSQKKEKAITLES